MWKCNNVRMYQCVNLKIQHLEYKHLKFKAVVVR